MPAAPWSRMRLIGWRRFRLLLVVGAGLIAAIVGLAFPPPLTPIAGPAEVTDGDTLRIGATRIRLSGIDAPELAQTCTDQSGREWPCGAEAKAFVIGVVMHERDLVHAARHRSLRPIARCLHGQRHRYRRAHCRGGLGGERRRLLHRTGRRAQRGPRDMVGQLYRARGVAAKPRGGRERLGVARQSLALVNSPRALAFIVRLAAAPAVFRRA